MTQTFNSVFVPGIPIPQGSTKAYVRGDRAVITHSNDKTMPWRGQVSAFIRNEVGSEVMHPTGGVGVALSFVMPRRAAEPKRVTPLHTRKPDLDKLIRCVLDGMTGLVFTDDAQVVTVVAGKRTAQLAEQPGVLITWNEVQAA